MFQLRDDEDPESRAGRLARARDHHAQVIKKVLKMMTLLMTMFMILKLKMIRTSMIWKYQVIDCGTLLLTTSTGALFLVDCLVPKMLHMSCDTPFTFPFVFMAAFQTCQVYLKLFSVDDLFPFNLSFPHQRSGQIIFFALFNVFIPSFCRIIMGALCIRKLCPRSSHP